MRSEGLRGARGILSVVLLTVAGALLGWLCFRTAMLQALPAASPSILRLAPHAPGVVLDNAAVALVQQHGHLDAATLAAVRRASAEAPLDARAFLVLGHQQLLDDQPQRALATLEAGQRLDPRQRVIHLLLLDRYLRTGRLADAAGQFSVLARLVGQTQEPVIAAMAQMSMAPQMRDAVRRTLRSDPVLERQVLVALAKSNTAPAAIFALASPEAQRDAGAAESWGPALIDRLVAHERYADARLVWQRVYGLTDAQVAAPLYDAGLRKLGGAPPFNWLLAAGSLGAADMRDNALAVDYYGRDSGELASQLLVLRPGSYRFAFTLEGGKTTSGPSLAWSLQCASGGKAELMRLAAPGTGTRRRLATTVTIPAGCAAQRLALLGESGEFPTPISMTLRDLDLRPASGNQP